MKKLISILLVITMLFTLMVPSFAVFRGRSQYPVIMLSGNGEDIYDEEGNVVYNFDYDTSNLANDIVEICMPHLLKGIATGDFSDYYDALYKKFAEIYGNAKLGPDGEVLAGTNVGPHRLQQNESSKRRGPQSTYGFAEYHFWYDWRIDPLELADRLADYIDGILASTGKEKVSLYGRCLGGTPIVAYLAKYGSEKLDTVCLDSVVTNGGEMIGETFTGKLNLDTDAILRFAYGDFGENIRDMLGDDLLFNLIISTVKLLNSLGVSDKVMKFFMDTLYANLGEGFVASFVRAGYATWPSYWTMVEAADYETAKKVIFGKKGSELRTEYAGLIEKLDAYYDLVTSRIPEILKETKESGTKVCIVSKYGSQLFPYLESYNEISDQWTTLTNASMGATTCKIGETLSDEYIAQRVAEGKGEYISLDKQVDASTCALPDNTWIIKGINHDNWSDRCEEIAYAVCTNVITDIHSDPDYPQFLCYNKEDDSIAPMTYDNMNCEDYYGNDTGSTDNLPEKVSMWKKLMSFFEFLRLFFSYIGQLLGGKAAE